LVSAIRHLWIGGVRQVKIIDFIFAARPMLHFPSWSIFLVAAHIIGGNGKDSANHFLALVGVTLMVAGVYFINQIYDYDTDLINRKLGFLQSGLIRSSEMFSAYLAVSLVGIIIGGAVGLSTLFLYLIIFMLGYIYSVPPFKLKDHPLGGLLINGIGFGIIVPLTVPGFWDCNGTIKLFLPIYFTLISAAGYLLTIIPDRKGDRLSGKITLATNHSDQFIIGWGMTLLILSTLCAFLMAQYYLIIFSVISLGLFSVSILYPRENIILPACKFPILLLSILAGCYYPAYFVFMLAVIIMTRLYFKSRFGIIYPRIN
jgi:4-hydroxybenzoate polyprenyltransferase